MSKLCINRSVLDNICSYITSCALLLKVNRLFIANKWSRVMVLVADTRLCCWEDRRSCCYMSPPRSVRIHTTPFSSALAFVISDSPLWLVSQAAALSPKLSASHWLHVSAQWSCSESDEPNLNSKLGGGSGLSSPNAPRKFPLFCWFSSTPTVKKDERISFLAHLITLYILRNSWILLPCGIYLWGRSSYNCVNLNSHSSCIKELKTA